MSRVFEELDRRPTPMGELVLRRRLEPTLQVDVFEVILGEEHLMSSLFTVAETELANLALAQLGGDELDVLVGGLGLGYTAHAALQHDRVRSVEVVEALGPVIEWHQRGLVPLAQDLTGDGRCHLIEADFFTAIAEETAGGPLGTRRWDAVLLDIDHTPRHVLHPSHASFYEAEGLRRLHDRLEPGGVFALWSDDPPDVDFMATLERAFTAAEAHLVTFPNPHTGGTASNTVYVARRAPMNRPQSSRATPRP